MIKGAQFSDCRNYRYALWRTWDESAGHVCFIGLNPSTADETIDDPTIRRCIGFAQRWQRGGIYMLNLFALRATDPKVMKKSAEPVGTMNDSALLAYACRSAIVVAAWGIHGAYAARGELVAGWLPSQAEKSMYCLGLTKSGHPKHPLYLPSDAALMPFGIPA